MPVGVARTWSPRFWIGANASTFIRIMARNRLAVHPALAAIAAADGVAALANSALGLIERYRFGEPLRALPRVTAPLFVLGHWRSGTTLLHELLALDRQLAAPTAYQCLAPHHFLLTGGRPARCLAPLFPEQRPMDEMRIGPGSPCEDEFALRLLGARSPYETFAFPNRGVMSPDQFDPATFPTRERARWIDALDRFTRKVACQAPGRRLLLKSPPHTARVRTLLELFPDARFVHIVRNPFEVFPSMVHTLSLRGAHGWQRPHNRGLAEAVFRIFSFLHQAFERDRSLIPPGRLHELRFEDLIAGPAAAVQRLYTDLGLGDPAAVLPAVAAYFATRQDYRRNEFTLPAETTRLVTARWAPVIQRYGYPCPAL